MNKIYFIFLILFSFTTSFAQDDKSLSAQEEKEALISDSLMNIEEEKHNGHFQGIDFGLNVLLNKSFTTSFPSDPQWQNEVLRSFNYNINFYDHKILLYGEKVGLTLGVGVNLAKFAFQNNYTLKDAYSKQDSVVYGSASVDTIAFTRNKLHLAYLQIPLLVEFTPTKNVWISAGLITGIKISSNVRQIYTDTKNKNYEFERTIKGSFGLNPFKLDATIRAGLGRTFGVYTSYSLIPIFNTTTMANVHPLSFGLSFNW
jgi:hypothetical protein